MTYNFNAAEETRNVLNWIKNWFETESGNAAGIIIGISGGADSTVVAKLCCDAVGKDKVRGVLMPNKHQSDIVDSYKICEILGIKHDEIDINWAYTSVINAVKSSKLSEDFFTEPTKQAVINIAPRIRMTILYALGQTLNYRVAGTGNLSERYVGYCTKWGDMAHDFNPIANFTKTEVKQIGGCLGLPDELVHKTPADGLSGLSDEENMKITYAVLDDYIRTRNYNKEDAKICEMIERIIKMNKIAQHKLKPIPCYINNI